MSDSKRLPAAIVFAAFLAPALVRADDAARELVREAWHESSRKTSRAELTLAKEDGGDPRHFEMKRMRTGEAEKINLKVESPYNYKGMRYLFLANDHYSYLPAMRRTLRIAEDSLSQPFLNSTFYVADMIPPDVDAYEYVFVGEEMVEGRACKLVESRKKRGGGLYGKTILAIDPADKVIVRTQFFDQDGELLKTWTVEKLERVDEVWTPLAQRMAPAGNGAAWRLTIDEVDYGATFDETDFSVVALDR